MFDPSNIVTLPSNSVKKQLTVNLRKCGRDLKYELEHRTAF